MAFKQPIDVIYNNNHPTVNFGGQNVVTVNVHEFRKITRKIFAIIYKISYQLSQNKLKISKYVDIYNWRHEFFVEILFFR